ncbi:HD domain-containing protein [Agarivorans aestuarii]|uniref:HD domain-containing protein n=1 Tax=Agarivorans aestuarii TaxID=1563703 RepID=A0ABU7FYV2_9ALTE|nr:HD domain-containing phosphohydrolase [Agarivorans aestuarii]MEE1672336.1 HD domain-containing protein [Agarivorans aestuarii]
MSKTEIPTQLLQVGHYISLPLGWTAHPFMRNNFLIKNNEQLTVIKSLGLELIEVVPSKSKVATPQLNQDDSVDEKQSEVAEVDPDQAWLEELRNGQKRANKAYLQNAENFRLALTKFTSKPEEAYYSIFEQVNITLQLMFKSSSAHSVYVSLEPSSDEDIFFHSVNVAVLAILVAKNLGFTEKECQHLCIAAMIHDIGELKVPQQIRRKPTEWSQAEQNFYQTHPKFGAELIKKAGSFPEEVLPIVINHHERLDGSGYPQGLKAKDLNKATQLLAIADAFEHLCSPLPNQKRMTPQEAFASLYKSADTKFNKLYLEQLMNTLGIYPPGSIVSLSNNGFAMVMSSNPKEKLKPRVLLLEKGKNFTNANLVDLSKEDLKINKTVKWEDVPAALVKNFDPKLRCCYFFDPEQ